MSLTAVHVLITEGFYRAGEGEVGLLVKTECLPACAACVLCIGFLSLSPFVSLSVFGPLLPLALMFPSRL